MNKNIKELAKRAGMSVYTPDQDILKFAELIAQECAMLASRHENNDDTDAVYNVITKHFGVK